MTGISRGGNMIFKDFTICELKRKTSLRPEWVRRDLETTPRG